MKAKQHCSSNVFGHVKDKRRRWSVQQLPMHPRPFIPCFIIFSNPPLSIWSFHTQAWSLETAWAVELQETSPVNPSLSVNSCSWRWRRQWINQRSHYCQITDMGSKINVSCLTPADSSRSDSFRSTPVIGRRPKLSVSSSCCASTCMAVLLLFWDFFPCWSLKKPCKASKSKHIFNDGYHYYFTIKLFFMSAWAA